MQQLLCEDSVKMDVNIVPWVTPKRCCFGCADTGRQYLNCCLLRCTHSLRWRGVSIPSSCWVQLALQAGLCCRSCSLHQPAWPRRWPWRGGMARSCGSCCWSWGLQIRMTSRCGTPGFVGTHLWAVQASYLPAAGRHLCGVQHIITAAMGCRRTGAGGRRCVRPGQPEAHGCLNAACHQRCGSLPPGKRPAQSSTRLRSLRGGTAKSLVTITIFV